MVLSQGVDPLKWAQLGSNQRPTSYEPAALTAELWALAVRIVAYMVVVVKGGNC